jgi:signal transduction histidine kinase
MRRYVIDAALAALLLAVGAVQLTLPAVPDERGFTKGGLLAAAVLVAITVPLVFRRRHPSAVFVVVTLGTLIGSPVLHARETSSEAVAHGLALFTLVEAVRLRWVTMAAAAVSVLVAWLHTQEITSFVYNLAFYGLVVAGGFFQGDRAAVQSELAQRADELEREHERLREAAVAAERARISVELRRIVAAEVDAMARDAQAAQEALADGASAEPWLAQIEARGRQALIELRRLLAVLRRQDEAPIAKKAPRAMADVPEPSSLLLRWFSARPWAADPLLYAALGASLTLEITRHTVPSTGTLAVVSTAGAIAALVLRRRFPLVTFAIVGGVIVLQQLELEPPLTTALLTTYMVATYAVAVSQRIAWSVVAVIGGAAAYAPHAPDLRVAAATMAFTGAVAIFAGALGRSVRTRARLLVDLSERVTRLNATRRQRAALAVAQERSRVAREMHDLVAHGVSLMVIQAGGAQSVAATDRKRAEEVIARLQEAAHETRRETQLMLADLDGQDEIAVPADGLAGLRERLRDAGMEIRLEEQGEPRPLGASIELSLYRIAQEALTNVRKHAPGAAADVRLLYSDDGVEVAVRNGPPRGTSSRPVPGAGHGLVGMRERVLLFNGSLRAAPLTDGGFEVRAQIPAPTV